MVKNKKIIPTFMKCLTLSILCLLPILGLKADKMPERIHLSENRHFLTDEQGHPFFYLADTAWELFHRLNREEAAHYLADRGEAIPFVSPCPGDETDWVLVIDVASKRYGKPGKIIKTILA